MVQMEVHVLSQVRRHEPDIAYIYEELEALADDAEQARIDFLTDCRIRMEARRYALGRR